MITDENIENTWEITRKLVEDCYPRLTGTEGNIKAGKLIFSIFDENCDESEVMEFKHRPKGFLKYLPIAATLHIIAIVLLFYNYILISSILFTINLLMVLSQTIFYWRLFDFLFPKETGRNIIGKIEPKNEVKQQIILSGHYDAPYVFQLLDKIPKFYSILVLIGMLTVFISFIGSIGFYISNLSGLQIVNAFNIYRIIIAILSIFVIPFYVFTTSEVSPGAGDNALSAAMVCEMSRIFAKNKLEHTRLIFFTPDSEEASLNGAHAYTEKYREELHKIPTYNINLDSIFTLDDFTIFKRDLNSTRKLSESENEIILKLASEMGHKIKVSQMPIGGGSTDSAEFSRIGIDSVSMLGLNIGNFNENSVYHSSRDTMDIISKDVIQFTLNLMEKYCVYKDEQVK